MGRRVAVLALALVAVAILPGCVVSLFSSSTADRDALERTERLEQRMDRVEETMRAP